jgi:CDP-diacylglycerol--serine O-phosphatidyltransferase
MLRGIYILPSLFTASNLAFGFVSIIYSIHAEYTSAAWCIMLAILMDIMDGRVARWTKTTSRFGVEFDSLADLVSFGIAPSLLMYELVLHTMHKPGIAISLFFVIAGAMRLARFNTKTQEGEASTEFSGLPIPAAAALLASFVLSYELFEAGGELTVKTIPLIMKRMPFFFKAIPLIMIILSFLMISTVPYAAFKKYKFDRPKSLQMISLVLIGLLLIITYPQNSIFIIFLFYLLSGIATYLCRWWRLRHSIALRLRKNRDGSSGVSKTH